MWVTPRMTDIFILKEFRKLRWLTARLQTWGGKGCGVTQGGPTVTKGCHHHDAPLCCGGLAAVCAQKGGPHIRLGPRASCIKTRLPSSLPAAPTARGQDSPGQCQRGRVPERHR